MGSCVNKLNNTYMNQLINSYVVTPRLPRHYIVRFAPLAHDFVSGDLARTSQGVTHPGTTPTLARLTAEFQELAKRVAPKRVVF